MILDHQSGTTASYSGSSGGQHEQAEKDKLGWSQSHAEIDKKTDLWHVSGLS